MGITEEQEQTFLRRRSTTAVYYHVSGYIGKQEVFPKLKEKSSKVFGKKSDQQRRKYAKFH